MRHMPKTIIVLLVVFFNLLFIAPSSASDLTEDIKLKLKQMGHDKPFVSFPLQLSWTEQSILSQLVNNETDDFNHFGNLEGFQGEVTQFIEALGNSRELSVSAANILENKINEIKQAFNAEAAWVTIRSFHDVNAYDTARWHTDGYYYPPFTGSQYKVGMVIKGPGTLFCQLSDEGRSEFNTIQKSLVITDEMTPDEILAKIAEQQSQLAALIEKYKTQQEAPIYQGEINSGVIFIVGDENSAAVHSEPPIYSDRLFVSVLPGTKEQIQELYDSWHSKLKKSTAQANTNERM